ncbi:hypothetical protein Tco_0025080 [Tanacetum coccineum]
MHVRGRALTCGTDCKRRWTWIMLKDLIERNVKAMMTTDYCSEMNPIRMIERTSRGFPEESKDTSLLQSLRICMRHSIMGPVTGSFDVINGMDWFAYHRALIDCYEKIVHIPLSNGKILEVQGERPKKDLRSLACIKADENKLDDIRVV